MLRSPRPAPSLGLARALIFLTLCLSLHAQTALTHGSVSGTVTDTTSSVIPKAHVALSTPDKTIVREATTGPDGSFTISALSSGTYQIEITAPGFAPYLNPSVAVAVGRDVRVDVQLPPAQATQQLTVQAQTQALDTSQTSPVTNIDRDRIEELPIPSRNYLNFTLLAPSLGSANPALGAQSPALQGEGGFSAGGLRPSSNALYIDGVDDNDEYTGLSRTELSPEAISDFQLVNHGYAAQSGGSAGGSVDVETRSGAKVQHGDAFLFVQNGALNATPALERTPRKPDANRLRAGLSTGGPIGHGKLFYYIAAEQELARGEEANDLSPNLTAAINSAIHQSGPLQNLTLQPGFFPTTNQETELSARIDRTSEPNSLMLRYALTNNRSVNDAFNTSDLFDLTSRGSAFYDDNSLNGSWSATFTPHLLNQLNFEAAQRRAVLRTASPNSPGIVIAGLAQFGTPYAGNTRRYETHADLSDDLTLQHGKHLLQTGVAFTHVGLRAADRDGFAGLYVFPDLASLANNQPDFFTQSFGNPNTNFAELRSAAYAQDHWTPTHSLAVDLGLRYESNQLPTPLTQSANHFSPRFGLAWSPDKNLVVRGGFGIFLDRYLLSTTSRILEFNGSNAQQQIVEGAAAAALYQSGQRFTAPPAGIAPSIWQPQPGLANPYAETASLGIERAFLSQWTASAEYRFVRGVKMGRTLNSNLPQPIALTAANAASLGIPSPTPQQFGRLTFPLSRLNPAYDAIHQFQTEASSSYNGVTLTANRQFTEDFELLAGYTFSKTLDDASSDTAEPQNPCALRGERALSLQDQRHRFVLSGLWVLGPDLDDPAAAAQAAAPGPIIRALTGLEFAPILTVSSGFRDNPVTGLDSAREHTYPFTARPLGLARNSLQTPASVDLDLRILKMVAIGRGHLDIVAESFNLLNRRNIDLLNPVYGSAATASADFKEPTQPADPRKIQFSLDFEF
jgi:hypothetical protein